MGRTCAAGGAWLEKSEYSKSQWRKGDGISRCTICVEVDGYSCDGGGFINEETDEEEDGDQRADRYADDGYVRETYTRRREKCPYGEMDLDDAYDIEGDVQAYCGDAYRDINENLAQGIVTTQSLGIQRYIEENDGYLPDIRNHVPYAVRDTDTHYLSYRNSYYDRDTLWALHNKRVYPMHFISTTRNGDLGIFGGDMFIFKLRSDRQDTWRYVDPLSEYNEDEVLIGLNARFQIRVTDTQYGLRVWLTQI